MELRRYRYHRAILPNDDDWMTSSDGLGAVGHPKDSSEFYFASDADLLIAQLRAELEGLQEHLQVYAHFGHWPIGYWPKVEATLAKLPMPSPSYWNQFTVSEGSVRATYAAIADGKRGER